MEVILCRKQPHNTDSSSSSKPFETQLRQGCVRGQSLVPGQQYLEGDEMWSEVGSRLVSRVSPCPVKAFFKRPSAEAIHLQAMASLTADSRAQGRIRERRSACPLT
ncbi:hypothetical protein SRHO_G00222980 [Serrasalmus rhombeus]